MFKMHPELEAKWKAAVAEERALLKKSVRAAIARKDRNWIFAYCCNQRAEAKRHMEEMFLYGQSRYMATEESALWVLRYCRRLGVPFV